MTITPDTSGQLRQRVFLCGLCSFEGKNTILFALDMSKICFSRIFAGFFADLSAAERFLARGTIIPKAEVVFNLLSCKTLP